MKKSTAKSAMHVCNYVTCLGTIAPVEYAIIYSNYSKKHPVLSAVCAIMCGFSIGSIACKLDDTLDKWSDDLVDEMWDGLPHLSVKVTLDDEEGD